MWFVIAISGMILAAACVSKWIDATIKIKQILREELEDGNSQDNSQDR